LHHAERSRLRRGLALGLAILVAAPIGLHADIASARAPESAPPTNQPTIDPALETSRELYQEGRARFDTFDYGGAVQLWTRAYAELPENADGIRNRLVYNIATAQQMAYDIDHDLQHLRQAILLLQRYVKDYRALHQQTADTSAEVERAEARIAELEQRIVRAETGEAEPDDEDEEPTPIVTDPHYGSGAIDGIVWTTTDRGAPDPDQLHRNRHLASEDHKTDRILIGSYVALSVGGLLTIAGTGAVLGTRGQGLGARGGSIAGLGLGLAGLTTGFTLLAIGLERRKRARQGTLVAGAPIIGPKMAGAAMIVRF